LTTVADSGDMARGEKQEKRERSVLGQAFTAVVERRLAASGRTKSDLGYHLGADDAGTAASLAHNVLYVADFPVRRLVTIATFFGVKPSELLGETADELLARGQ
jgi:hypothetical protein